MNKTILFPTDFSVKSLQLAKKAMEDYPGSKLNFILIHGIHSSDSITDLLFFSKSRIIGKLSNPEFEEACRIFRNIYEQQVNSLTVELFSGFTQSAFNSLAENLKVDLIYVPEPFSMSLKNKISADLSKFISKNTITKVVVQIQTDRIEMSSSQSIPNISFIK